MSSVRTTSSHVIPVLNQCGIVIRRVVELGHYLLRKSDRTCNFLLEMETLCSTTSRRYV